MCGAFFFLSNYYNTIHPLGLGSTGAQWTRTYTKAFTQTSQIELTGWMLIFYTGLCNQTYNFTYIIQQVVVWAYKNNPGEAPPKSKYFGGML